MLWYIIFSIFCGIIRFIMANFCSFMAKQLHVRVFSCMNNLCIKTAIYNLLSILKFYCALKLNLAFKYWFASIYKNTHFICIHINGKQYTCNCRKEKLQHRKKTVTFGLGPGWIKMGLMWNTCQITKVGNKRPFFKVATFFLNHIYFYMKCFSLKPIDWYPPIYIYYAIN